MAILYIAASIYAIICVVGMTMKARMTHEEWCEAMGYNCYEDAVID